MTFTVYWLFFLDQGITLEYCIFNPKKWYMVSLMNFFTAQSVLFLLLHLLPLDRSARYLKFRTALSLSLYFLFLPWMFLYNLYGSFVIQNPDNRLARDTHHHCYAASPPKLFLSAIMMLVFFEQLVMFLMGYGVYIRFKHFRRVQHVVADMTWMHALDFAWLVMFTNVLNEIEVQEAEEREASERLFEAALSNLHSG